MRALGHLSVCVHARVLGFARVLGLAYACVCGFWGYCMHMCACYGIAGVYVGRTWLMGMHVRGG